jgi:hypothetical protein
MLQALSVQTMSARPRTSQAAGWEVQAIAEQLAAPTTSTGTGPGRSTVTRKAVFALVTVLVGQALFALCVRSSLCRVNRSRAGCRV